MICTLCGTIINKDDAAKHRCDVANIPAKGEEKIPSATMTEVIV